MLVKISGQNLLYKVRIKVKELKNTEQGKKKLPKNQASPEPQICELEFIFYVQV